MKEGEEKVEDRELERELKREGEIGRGKRTRSSTYKEAERQKEGRIKIGR